ncbi:hypothetical protein BBP40_010306 [Aspergillus hancockii]|nr:hypothetical protein BBP40_010306 [Aspergillus hancockii]
MGGSTTEGLKGTSICGTVFTTGNKWYPLQRRATIGGDILLDGMYYGVTVAHSDNDFDSGISTISSELKAKGPISLRTDTAFAEHVDEKRILGSIPSKGILHTHRIGAETDFWSTSNDWALIELDNLFRHRPINSVFTDCGAVSWLEFWDLQWPVTHGAHNSSDDGESPKQDAFGPSVSSPSSRFDWDTLEQDSISQLSRQDAQLGFSRLPVNKPFVHALEIKRKMAQHNYDMWKYDSYIKELLQMRQFSSDERTMSPKDTIHALRASFKILEKMVQWFLMRSQGDPLRH